MTEEGENMQPNMKNNTMDKKDITALLERLDVGVLSTIGEDGFPYSTPVNFVYMDGSVYIHGRNAGTKVDNLKNTPKVSFTAWERIGYEDTGTAACDTTTVYESVIIKGNVEFVDDPTVKKRMLEAIVKRLVPDKTGMSDAKIPPTIVYKINATEITGKYHRPSAGNKVRNR